MAETEIHSEIPRPSVLFLDETSPQGRVFFRRRLMDLSSLGGMSTVSPEGFYHNSDNQVEIGRMFGRMVSGQEGTMRKFLEIGPGRSDHIARGITEVNSNAEVTLLDKQDYQGTEDAEIGLSDRIHRVVGATTDDISERFDGIVLHASLFSGQYNNTVQEHLGLGVQEEQADPFDFGDSYKDRVLDKQQEFIQQMRTLMRPNGQLLVTSSRYAFHGGGYSDASLPEEKLQFLNLIQQAVDVSSNQISIIGTSVQGVTNIYEYNFGENSPVKQERRKLAEDELTTIKAWSGNKEETTEAGIVQEISRQQDMAARSVRELTTGIDGLAYSDSDKNIFSQARFEEVKKKAKRLIPKEVDKNIGRIDAVVLQFP